MYTSGKLQRVPLKNTPPPITNYHTKVSQHTTLHYTESLHRRSSAGWLKLSSPEFPRLACVIKVDEGRRLARRAQKWSSAWGSLCSVHGERLFCLVPFTLQNMYCLQFIHWMPRLSLSYFYLWLCSVLCQTLMVFNVAHMVQLYRECFYNESLKCIKWQ